MRSGLSCQLLALVALLSGCEFFSDDDEGEFGDDGTDTSSESGTSETDTGDLPPTQGFRVYPKFMIQDVSAIVTVESAGLPAEPCELDGAPEGGYLCGTDSLPGPTATIRVERDGFEPAIRNPEIVAFDFIPLDVHLSVDGGPTGTWSTCVPLGEFVTCVDVCAAEALSCAVTSCATGQPEWPVATYEMFTGVDCAELVESVAVGCEEELPIEAESLRCCC